MAHNTTNGSPNAAISNLIVRVTNEYTGRGPTKARTHISEDLVSVVLEDTLTKGERRLAGNGHAQQVESMRLAFQKVMADDYVAGIEEITGRKVRAFLSANHVDPDIAVETFLLEPTGASAH